MTVFISQGMLIWPRLQDQDFSRLFVELAKLMMPQLSIVPATPEQLAVGPRFKNAAVTNHQDLIRVHNGRETVRDDDRSPLS
eukprot:m.449828 g.449828  ORF g.449828 m.449828 type:complete len:82 (-) comp19879_c0_seq1:1918-2163(-)